MEDQDGDLQATRHRGNSLILKISKKRLEAVTGRIATLETETKNEEYMEDWFHNWKEKYVVLVAEKDNHICRSASLNPYSHRRAYDRVVSIYKLGAAIEERVLEKTISSD